MTIEKVLTKTQIETVAGLAFEIWNQHFIPIIGKAQVDYMLEKFQFFEESIRIPLIMSYPAGMAAGLRPAVPATGADMAPTILDFCGVDPLPQFHGRSLRPAAEGRPADPGSDPWAFAETRGYSCFRSRRWKVIYDPEKNPVMVFDLQEDPGEFVNLLEGNRNVGAVEIAEELRKRIPSTVNSLWRKR